MTIASINSSSLLNSQSDLFQARAPMKSALLERAVTANSAVTSEENRQSALRLVTRTLTHAYEKNRYSRLTCSRGLQ